MAELSEQDRQKISRGLMRFQDLKISAPNVLKADLLAAVNAADTWIDSNQGSYNTALPEAFRTNATLSQKTLLFCAVALMRVGEVYLRRLFGAVTTFVSIFLGAIINHIFDLIP